jgi:hypothetical protein
MSDQERRFWPFRPQTSIAWSIAMLVGLLFILLVLKRYDLWEISQRSDTTVLIGVLLVSLLPVVLAVLDIIIERRGVIEAGGVRIDFSQGPQMGMSGFTVPPNIGVPGQAVADSGTNEILDALRQATTSESVIVDFEEGQAWWETRLLVLLAGAVRHNQPKIVVFVGTDGKTKKCFQGWASANELLPYLLKAHPKYPVSYYAALAAARQWELVEPQGPNSQPPLPEWMQQPKNEPEPGNERRLAESHAWMAFDYNTGLPNKFFAEQLLASELGEKVEQDEPPRTISLVRLEELFRPVLHQEYIDESWPSERQRDAFFDRDTPYIAVTENHQFKVLVSRVSVLNTMAGTLVRKK